MKDFFRGVWILIVVLIVLSVVFGTCRALTRPFAVADKVLSVDNIISSYRMFFSMKADIESSAKNIQLQKDAIAEIEEIWGLRDENGKLLSNKVQVLDKTTAIEYRTKKDGLQIMISQLNEQISNYNQKAQDATIGIFNGTACNQIENCVELPQQIELYK